MIFANTLFCMLVLCFVLVNNVQFSQCNQSTYVYAYEGSIECFVKQLQKQLPELEKNLKQQMYINSRRLLELGKEISYEPSERQAQFVTVF